MQGGSGGAEGRGGRKTDGRREARRSQDEGTSE